MDHLIIEPPFESKENASTRQLVRPSIVLAAWAAMLLLSNLPLVIARELFGTNIPWILPAWLGAALLLFAASFLWQWLRPLRWYFLMMALIIFLAMGVTPLVQQSALWQAAFTGKPVIVLLLATRALLVLETLLVLAALALLGWKRKDMFQVTGDLNAPVEGIRLPGQARPLRWLVFGTLMAVLLGGLFFTLMLGGRDSAVSILANALPALPLILICAAGNAFAEEGMYRAAPMALLRPAVGANHALWLTAVWFGLGHFYGGIPSGFAGLLMTGLLGLLLGRAMLDTRGMGWPMIIHIVLDTVIFIFLVAG